MVSGFFTKAPYYTLYQERTRIIAVSSKDEEYSKEIKRQIIFCVSDLYIKVWRMEARGNRTEFTVSLLYHHTYNIISIQEKHLVLRD